MSEVEWRRILAPGELDEGRVTTVTVGRRSFAVRAVRRPPRLRRHRLPHQGGPFGEGWIERGRLRCPWHGSDCSPITGEPPAAFSDDAVRTALDHPGPALVEIVTDALLI